MGEETAYWYDPANLASHQQMFLLNSFDKGFIGTISTTTLATYDFSFVVRSDLVSLLEYLYSLKWQERFPSS